MIRNYRSQPCRKSHSEYNTDIDFASIDCWEELLERPLEEGIVRAHGNWQARLAAAALGVQRGHKTFVLSEDFCWNCYEVDAEEGNDVFDEDESVANQNGGADAAQDAESEHYGDEIVEEDDDSSSDGMSASKVDAAEDAGHEHYGDDIVEEDDDSSLDGIGATVEEQNNGGIWRREVTNPNVLYIM